MQARILSLNLLTRVSLFFLLTLPAISWAQPNASYSINPNPVCTNTTVTFTDLSTGNNLTYYWIFGVNSIPQTATGPGPHQVTYPNPGQVTTGLWVTDGSGNFDSLLLNINVITSNPVTVSAPNTICEGTPASFMTMGSYTPNATFAWDFGLGAVPRFSNSQNPGPIQFPNTGPYNGKVIISDRGCTDSTNLNTNVLPIPISFTGPDTIICEGDAVQLQGSYQSQNGFVTAQWIPAVGLSNPNILNPFASPSQITTYLLQVTDNNGCTSVGDFTIITPLPCDSVWPGDANSDGVANNVDILTLGLVNGRTGFSRMNASLNWVGQPAFDWADTLANGADIKHADCNGDGTVNVMDTSAIKLNYGQLHNKTGESNGGVLLYAEVLQDSLNIGDTATVIIYLGKDTMPADSIYGLAFTLSFDQTLLRDTAAVSSISYDTTWLAQTSTNLLNFDYYLPDDGEIDFAITRLNHQNKSGYGRIARADIIMVEDLSGKRALAEKLTFEFTDIKAVSSDGEDIPVSSLPAEVVVVDPTTLGMQDGFNGIQPKVYPQPVEGYFVIDLQQSLPFTARLYSLEGRIMWEGEGIGKAQFEAQGLSAAYYLLEIETREGRVFEKLIIR